MFEELFTDGITIGRYRAAPLLDERLRWLEHCAGDRCPAVHVAQNRQLPGPPGSPSRPAGWWPRRHHPCRGRSGAMVTARRTPTQSARRDRTPDRSSSATPCDGCVSWTCSPRNRACRGTLMRAKSRSSQTGCARSGAGPRIRFTVAATLSIVFFDRLDDSGITLASVCIEDIDDQIAYWHARGPRPEDNQVLRATPAGLLPLCRGPGLVHGGACRWHPARRGFHPGETIPKGLTRDEVPAPACNHGWRPARRRTQPGPFSCC